MQKQIKLTSDHFNFANVPVSASFYEPMKIQVLFSTFSTFHGFFYKKKKKKKKKLLKPLKNNFQKRKYQVL